MMNGKGCGPSPSNASTRQRPTSDIFPDHALLVQSLYAVTRHVLRCRILSLKIELPFLPARSGRTAVVPSF